MKSYSVLISILTVFSLLGGCEGKERNIYTTPNGTPARVIEEQALSLVGKTVNWSTSPQSVISVSDTKDGKAKLVLRANVSSDRDQIRNWILWDSQRLIPALFESSRLRGISEYSLEFRLLLFNDYGSGQELPVARLTISRDVASKIVWGRVSDDSLIRVLESEGEVWFEPSALGTSK